MLNAIFCSLSTLNPLVPSLVAAFVFRLVNNFLIFILNFDRMVKGDKEKLKQAEDRLKIANEVYDWPSISKAKDLWFARPLYPS